MTIVVEVLTLGSDICLYDMLLIELHLVIEC